jgi:hypothetical protein
MSNRRSCLEERRLRGPGHQLLIGRPLGRRFRRFLRDCGMGMLRARRSARVGKHRPGVRERGGAPLAVGAEQCARAHRARRTRRLPPRGRTVSRAGYWIRLTGIPQLAALRASGLSNVHNSAFSSRASAT